MMDEEGFPVPGFPGLVEDQYPEGFLLPEVPEMRSIAEDNFLRVPMVVNEYPEEEKEAALDRTSVCARLPCKESGEAALYPVLVFRRPPERIRSGVSEGGRRRFRIDESRETDQTTMETEESRRMLEMEFPTLFMSPDVYPIGEERLNRVLHIPIYQGCLCNDPACPMSLTAAKPIKAGPTSPQKERKNQIRVTHFNELVYGAKIFDHQNDDEKKVLKNFVMLRFVPFILIQLIYTAMLHLWKCVPYLRILGLFRQLYSHVRIHQVGDEKGIEPVFPGSVYNGPVMYAIRIVKCPYCKHKAEAKIFQRYLESTYKERRAAVVAESGKNVPVPA